MTPPAKTCPSCGHQCPPKALRCRCCDNWFPEAHPRPNDKRHWFPAYLGAVLILMALLFIARFYAQPQDAPPVADTGPRQQQVIRGPPPADATEWLDYRGNLWHRSRNGSWPWNFNVSCNVCNGSGMLVGTLTGRKQVCWRCEGRGFILYGLEQQQNEPLAPSR